MTPEPVEDLVDIAHHTHIVVVGGGIAGLVAAYECAKVGIPVTVVEARSAFGGTIAGAEVAGVTVDTGATCWTGGGSARSLVDELGLADRVVVPRANRTWIAGLGKGATAAPVPEESVLGIPANPWAEDVRPFIGLNGAWRAYLDRLRPPLTIGKERSLAKLVRTRMGDAVLDRMVAPLTAGRFGMTPAEVDVAVAAPGLSSALTRTGSLGGAVADVRVGAPSRPSVESLDGGMPQLVTALVDRLAALGAELILDAPVSALARTEGGRWTLEVAAADAPVVREADVVIVATAAADARTLLAPHAPRTPQWGTDAATLREIVTLVVDAPTLDTAPRGAEVYPVPGTARASGLVHQTARWEWLARSAGPGRHVLSVAFDEVDGRTAISDLDDAGAAVIAREEASALLGADLRARDVAGAHRARFTLARPASALGHSVATEAARAAIAVTPGLAAVGAWLSGSGLERVVSDTVDEAERVRRGALWGGSAAI